ncbi:ABC transporter substrate-binding protein [Comamonas testosteroni]|uniref:ABC transporter substrate-binding protein n=2 Tax=Comamonas testosteroni TaxID=285 RepID=A0A5A7MI11_COMTE|nr:ABC transporter substrate-binding protein [Comamonas testosteroni]
MKARRKILAAAMAASAAGISLPGMAQDSFPSREITLVVSYTPGGVTDLQARTIATHLGQELNTNIIVKNMPGAQGTLGQEFVRRSKPDGYTLAMVTSSSTALSPYLVNDVYKPTDFDYVGGVGTARFGLVVKADSPYQNIGQFVEASKRKPIFYGSSSAITTMGFDKLAKVSGGGFEVINYKSGPEIVTAMLGGYVAALMQAPSEVMPFIDSGKARLLASSGATRWPSAPGVPTLREAGYDVAIESWGGVAAPKGLPASVIKRLRDALQRTAAKPAMVRDLNALGIQSSPLSGPEFGAKMQQTFVEAALTMKAMVKQ